MLANRAAALRAGVGLQRLLPFVQLNSERPDEPVRRDDSFAEKQESHRALLHVVRGESKTDE